ncbi:MULTISPECIES: response regulator [unclassified Empedobacter]|uniref:response regulator n=1 Tax=unclassified Empedobacter TaxID=2643773 RepID=UPI0025BAB4EF|nr:MULTISPECIES: response regulator [unclassified Empedobacter]
MKILLIDDLAEKGWKSILELAVIKETGSIESAINIEEAYIKLNNKYDVIFLDMRLSEADHNVKNVEEYSGFKLLKHIKNEFTSINFSSPIILFTASTKIWNIDKFKEYGVDCFYIKEHPDHIYSSEFSKENLKNLQESFLNLIKEGYKRYIIWKKCIEIINCIDSHKYFKRTDKRFINVKQRIIDKLKLGYGQLFSKQSFIEKNTFEYDKESVSFIIFFSILEEISKGYTDINNTWDGRYKRSTNWKFKNGDFFIEYIDNEICKVNFNKYSELVDFEASEYKYFNDNTINLSDQIFSLIYAYTKDKHSNLIKSFNDLNYFRNKSDYTHSNVQIIFNDNLTTDIKSEESFHKNIEMLNFLFNLLRLA